MNEPVPIRILIVDDQRLMRDGLRTLLELEDGLVVVGEAEEGQVALDLYADLLPDVVLMDVRMPGLDGVETTHRLINTWPAAKVIILTTFDDDAYLFEALRAGALGYLLKDVSGKELTEAIHKVAGGGALIQPSITRKVLAEFSRLTPITPPSSLNFPEPLTEREIEVLRLITKGLTNKEIATRINLTEGTVKNYVTVIFQKLRVQDRTQAALKARDLGL